jgi:hypothetical protein
MKTMVIFLCFFVFLISSIFSQNIDHRNWKKLEEEMYNLAKRCYEYANSKE